MSLSKTGLHKSCSERKENCLHAKAECHFLYNERFQHPPAFSVPILAQISELFFFYISYMFTSVCEYHGNISSECHCITATPRKILIHHLDCSASRFQHILISDCLLPRWKEKPSHTQISVPPTSVPLIFVFKDSFLHYHLPNLNITDVTFQCVCCVWYCIAFSIRQLQ